MYKIGVHSVDAYAYAIMKINMYGTAQRQLDTCTQSMDSALKVPLVMGMQVPVGVFPVSSRAGL